MSPSQHNKLLALTVLSDWRRNYRIVQRFHRRSTSTSSSSLSWCCCCSFGLRHSLFQLFRFPRSNHAIFIPTLGQAECAIDCLLLPIQFSASFSWLRCNLRSLAISVCISVRRQSGAFSACFGYGNHAHYRRIISLAAALSHFHCRRRRSKSAAGDFILLRAAVQRSTEFVYRIRNSGNCVRHRVRCRRYAYRYVLRIH